MLAEKFAGVDLEKTRKMKTISEDSLRA